MTSATPHSKGSKNPFIIAMALGAGLFLVLQLVANRLLPPQTAAEPSSLSSSSSSTMMLPDRQQAAVQRPAVDFPVDLFNDEFFASPFMIDSSLIQMKRELEKEMEELSGAAAQPLLRRHSNAQQSNTIWKEFDIAEDDEKVTVTASVPKGVDKKNISIEVIDGSVLHISGSRKEEETDGGKWKSETRFDKRFALGRHMEQDKIEANLKDGVLTITTPKTSQLSKEEEIRKIPIEVASEL